jgi:UDP-N-acetylmuramoyl-tripeptide--D-alanyl-D-alanine ligase
MIDVLLSQIARQVGGQLIGGDRVIRAISTDTRHIQDEAMFVALVGERFDAHDFIEQALANGAQALMVSHQIDLPVAQVLVEDTKHALGLLASWVHRQNNIPTGAVTGSCGKTTVKEMAASILSKKGSVLFTQGNFNNEIGVPLTLLRSNHDYQYAVIELGANHLGEIAYTTQLVKPDVALVNNVAAAHLEGFGSLEGVIKAKGEIFQGLEAGSAAIINLDSYGEALWDEVLADKKVVTFSVVRSDADFFADNIKLNHDGQAIFTLHCPLGSQLIELPIVGRHNVSNALAAAALSVECGVSVSLNDISSGLSLLPKVNGRVEVVELSSNIKLIDDSYNASVPAMKAAVDLLSSFCAKRWLILGNMAELGHETLALHRQVGEHAAPSKFEFVLTYGDDARVISDVCQGQHFSTHKDMISFIEQQLDADKDDTHILLVKGANSAGMSKVAAALKEKYS